MNIRYLHERLSRIEEITVVGKNTVVDGVICHVMGVVRYGMQLRLLVLKYDEVFRQHVEEAEVPANTVSIETELFQYQHTTTGGGPRSTGACRIRKSYPLHYGSVGDSFFVCNSLFRQRGSSNISESAMTSGLEVVQWLNFPYGL
ncbi:hypothetical protein [Desulfosporosinus sp. BICA1-9]|uniref:hypothetical protein n=1 Tax=Desulfosporosinus sp. BICA1-9 TaxID=1531958 RepID=UPI00054B143C|nr:hypothetical protein [Desulfosporosinus sp. BICA1-9]KJS46904.1 MAG: hypothetical protein VR66_22770 [Peptococcaceae bacterium BRH_c23]KJS89972.1 MAG: hypothetical protein JL57_04340 [Desulfosporosinus sp. BICA1-9]HBW37886.1 hypothetical protein [Desulfosporosinus sp.]